MHKPACRRFIKNVIYVAGTDAQWQSNQADIQGIAWQDGGIRYFLFVVYLFFNFARAVTVYFKDYKAITHAFGQHFTPENPRHLRRLQTDKGKEFVNLNVQALIKLHIIQHFASNSELKAAVMERLNLTRIWTYLSHRETLCWVDVILDLINAYNHSLYRSIGMAQADVQSKYKTRFWVRLLNDWDTHIKPFISTNDIMRSANKYHILTRITCLAKLISTLLWVRHCHL